MHPIDYTVIVFYFALVIGTGFWYQRRASRNLDSYFLGGKRMHWLALAMSGSVSNFDITGTMWIVTLITLFGFKSMWNHWMWGFLMGAFFLAFMGKWIRRSKVMTGAEWMVTRFGDDTDGRTARTAYALVAVVTVAGFIGYAFQGIGKFSSVFVNLKPMADLLSGLFPGYSEWIWFCAGHETATCALVVFGITTLYVLLGGLTSVVITDVIQTVILSLAAVLIAVMAYTSLTPELLERTLVDGWSSPVPSWTEPWAAELSGTKFQSYAYYCFGALVIVWVIKGLLLNLGGPAQMYDFQRFLAARNPRDAAKVGAAWSVFLIVRWAMAMGLALLAITSVAKTAGLEKVTPLAFVESVEDPEKIMPMVLKDQLHVGVRSIVIAGLLAAFMSTFSSTINAGASYLVRDIWQPLVRPEAGEKHLVRVGYVATLLLAVVGTMIGLMAESIGQMFNWIMVELGAAFIVPNVLRWYWWRFNGWGYAIGTFVGLAGALLVLVLTLFTEITLPLYYTFPALCAVSLVASLAGTLWTRPTDEAILVPFFRNVRPFGAWGPIRRQADLSAEELHDPVESLRLAVVNVLLGGVAILGMYLFPMYLVGHWHVQAVACLAMAVAAVVALYFTWYRNLPESEG